MRMTTPSGGAVAPAVTASAARAGTGVPWRQVAAARAVRVSAWAAVSGGRTRRGPCRSMRRARRGLRAQMVRP
ncbi:hypothetical protein BJF79_46815 [Actinomadura sp. CNU-125]|nr:hypothetical protein BJF79_46815 [Actinomadura sp. CNU-125]